MKFPVTIRFRKAECKIYGKTSANPYYRVCGYVAGKRRSSHHRKYADAKAAAEKLAREIASGSQVAALTNAQAQDALGKLKAFRRETGREVSLFESVAEYCEAARKLNGQTLTVAVDGFLSTVATVKRVALEEAVESFIAFRESKTKAAEGRRAALSFDHWRNTSYWLREFSDTFPGHAVCDLNREHLDLYLQRFAKQSPKSRNERRSILKMFFKWSVANDFLTPAHRLAEANHMQKEPTDAGQIECYKASELFTFLSEADEVLMPVLAMAGLAGLREKEILRLTWEEIWGVPGHIEVNAAKAKTRSRRLVEMCPALHQWLTPYEDSKGEVWTMGYKKFHEQFRQLQQSTKIRARRNGLRRGFVSAHLALYSNEGRTAQQAGNSPDIVHRNYKGLWTKAEGKAWFNVVPKDTAKNIIPLTGERPRSAAG